MQFLQHVCCHCFVACIINDCRHNIVICLLHKLKLGLMVQTNLKDAIWCRDALKFKIHATCVFKVLSVPVVIGPWVDTRSALSLSWQNRSCVESKWNCTIESDLMKPTISCWALLKQQYESYVQPLSVCIMIGGLTGSLDNGNPAATSSPRKSRHCSHLCLRAHHPWE